MQNRLMIGADVNAQAWMIGADVNAISRLLAPLCKHSGRSAGGSSEPSGLEDAIAKKAKLYATPRANSRCSRNATRTTKKATMAQGRV